MIAPDGIDQFTVPAEYVGDPLFDDYEMTHEIKVEIFSQRINWFRD